MQRNTNKITFDYSNCRCYALGEITADSDEFRKANEELEQLTTNILANALKIEDSSEEKRLVVKLHEACGFDLVSFMK